MPPMVMPPVPAAAADDHDGDAPESPPPPPLSSTNGAAPVASTALVAHATASVSLPASTRQAVRLSRHSKSVGRNRSAVS